MSCIVFPSSNSPWISSSTSVSKATTSLGPFSGMGPAESVFLHLGSCFGGFFVGNYSSGILGVSPNWISPSHVVAKLWKLLGSLFGELGVHLVIFSPTYAYLGPL
jgi:hypothetical protein